MATANSGLRYIAHPAFTRNRINPQAACNYSLPVLSDLPLPYNPEKKKDHKEGSVVSYHKPHICPRSAVNTPVRERP